MRLQGCLVCNAIFIPTSPKDLTCSDCRNKPREARPGKCSIYEAPGRCFPFIRGECRECWKFVLVENWKGWHSHDCENYEAMIYPEDKQE